MADLNRKYRLIWDLNTNYIQNDYETDWFGTITRTINTGNFESDTYQDILDKIQEEGLQMDPSLNV